MIPSLLRAAIGPSTLPDCGVVWCVRVSERVVVEWYVELGEIILYVFKIKNSYNIL